MIIRQAVNTNFNDWPTLRINVSENQKGNQELEIERHMQWWTQKTQDEDKKRNQHSREK